MYYAYTFEGAQNTLSIQDTRIPVLIAVTGEATRSIITYSNAKQHVVKLLFSFGEVEAVDQITEAESIYFFLLFVHCRGKEDQ